MSGIDLDKLASDNPEIARGRAVVDFVNQVARLLRNIRSDSGLSQAEMANALGVSQPRIAQLESGKPGNAPSVEQIAQYAFQCGRSLVIGEKLEAQSEAIQINRDLARDVRELTRSVQSLTEQLQTINRSARGAQIAGFLRGQPERSPPVWNLPPLGAGTALGGTVEPVIGRALAETRAATEEVARAMLVAEVEHVSDAFRKALEEVVASDEIENAKDLEEFENAAKAAEEKPVREARSATAVDLARSFGEKVKRAVTEKGSAVGSKVRDMAKRADMP